jgi:hypothetical protein
MYSKKFYSKWRLTFDFVFLHPVFQHHKQPQFRPPYRGIIIEKSFPICFEVTAIDEIPLAQSIDPCFTKSFQLIFHPYLPGKKKTLFLAVYNFIRQQGLN